MSDDSDIIPALVDLNPTPRADLTHPATASAPPKPSRIPDRRIITAGGIVLRAAGVLLIIAGFYPLLWTIIELYWKLAGTQKDVLNITLGQQTLRVHMEGWPAIIFGLIWSMAVWAASVMAFALGHALYVIRDLMKVTDPPGFSNRG